MVHNSIKPEFPLEAKVSISKYTVAAGDREAGWAVQVLRGKAIVLTPLLQPDHIPPTRCASTGTPQAC